MAARARMLDPVSAKADCERVTAPTLVVTGELTWITSCRRRRPSTSS
jgi:hypothetical protein